MSNLSGIGDNKTYRGSLPPREPYYYIRANLDLSGKAADNKVYYFNRDNSFAYTDGSKTGYPNPDSYPGYYMIEDNAVIGEVAVYNNPELTYSSGAEGELHIPAANLIAVSRTGGVASLILDAPASSFGLAPGDYISVLGFSNSGFDTSSPVAISAVSAVDPRATDTQIVAVSRDGSNVATMSLSASASSFGLSAGRYISVSGLSNAGFNTSLPVPILAVNPAVSKASGAAIVSVARAAGVATITLNALASTFGLASGDFVIVSGITNDSNSFNTPLPVAITVSGSTISYANAAGSATVLITAALGASKDVSYPPNFTYSNSGVLSPIAAAGGGASKTVAFPPKLSYPNAGSIVTDTAAAGADRRVMMPILFEVGGLYRPSSGSVSMDVWGGPSGNAPGFLTLQEIANGQSCYYGSEPLDPDYDALDGSRRYLGLRISGGSSPNKIVSGNLFVVLKVYPKFR